MAPCPIPGILDTTDPFDKQMATLHGAGVLNQIAGDQSPVGTHCTLYPSAIKAPIKVYIHDGAHVYPPWAPESFVSFFKSHALPVGARRSRAARSVAIAAS